MDIKKLDFLKNKKKKTPPVKNPKEVEFDNLPVEDFGAARVKEDTLENIFGDLDIVSAFYNAAPVDEAVQSDSQSKAISDEDNIIRGEKTGTTMSAEVMMEREGDDNGKILPDEENIPKYRPDMFSAPRPVEENIQFDAGVPEGAKVAKGIIDKVPQFDIKPIVIQDFDTIDIEIPDVEPEDEDMDIALADENFSDEEFIRESLEELIQRENLAPLPKHEEEEEVDNFKYEKLFGKQEPVPAGTTQVSRVPVYTPDSRVEKLNVNVGKFSVVVRQEYEEYLKSKNPEISATYKPTETVITEEIKSVKGGALNAVMEFLSANPDEEKFENRTTAEKVVTIDDYDSRDDIESVTDETEENIRKLRFQSMSLGVLTAVTLAMVILQKLLPASLGHSSVSPVIYSVLNILLLVSGAFISRVAIRNGLLILRKFKGNSDTAVAVGVVAGLLSSLVSLFVSKDYYSGNMHYYTIIIMLGLLCNAFGKLIMVKRVKRNFNFLADNKRFFSGKIYTDETIASKMMSGTVIDKPIIAYQHKTGFLTNFLQLSYAPDPAEDSAGKIAPFTTVYAVAVAILYGIIAKDFAGAFSVLSLITAVSVPLCVLLCINVPMATLCKKLLRKGAMLCGYQGVKQFCDTSAILVDASELYPDGSVMLNNIQAFDEMRIDESCLAAAAVLKEVKSPLASVFNQAIQESRMVLPDVESVMYEDQLGLVGWVSGERVLVGNRDLMNKYGIGVPDSDFEEKYARQHKQVTFLAHSGVLVAMLITTYRPNVEIARELQRAEYNGISLLISTSDCNITSEQISEDFGVFYRSVKVLPTGLGNVCKEVTSTSEDKSRAYLATKGKFTQLARALSGCAQMKSNINIAVIIQLIGIVLGILIMATITLYSGTGVLGTVEMLLYSAFWGIASMVAPGFRRP